MNANLEQAGAIALLLLHLAAIAGLILVVTL
jgi:hypothetical protein